MPTGFTGMGCGCCGCSVTFTIRLCSAIVSGATVAIKSGATTIASGTTSALGLVTLDIGSAGTYTVTVSKTGIGTANQTMDLACGLPYTFDYGPSGSALTLTDANTSISMTFLGGIPRQWTGSYVLNILSGIIQPAPGCRWLTQSVGPLTITYNVMCNTNGTVRVERVWSQVNDILNGWAYFQDGTGSGCTFPGTGSDKTAAPTSFTPFAWSNTLVRTGSGTADPVGGTVVLS